MQKLFAILLFSFPFFGNAQTVDSVKAVSLEGVVVTAYKDLPIKRSSLSVNIFKIDSLTFFGNYNLTDMLAKSPGVSSLSTGVAIAKPVIRGLYGNRVLVLLNGLRFDNQQWQEEHGLGLSDIGLSKVELIKGPMSVLYGSEAIGGVINIIEEEPALLNTKSYDISSKINSNTLGGQVQFGYKVNKNGRWKRLRLALENNGDYSDGNNSRVLNSRFDGYYVKYSFGFEKKNRSSSTNFSSSFNRFGFIFNDIYSFVTPDARWSRTLNVNPAHFVLLNILSHENKFYLKNNTILSANVGLQSNQRLENEGGGAISLNMHLLTLQYLVKLDKRINANNRLILSTLGSFEDNTNFGARKIIPDAQMIEGNLSAYIETRIRNKFIFENGLGLGNKFIKTFFTATVNSPEKDIAPFTKSSVYYNAYSGLSYVPSSSFNAKINIATGVRIPNLAELSSNGLHEGVFTYEVGSPLLKNEQNVSLNFSSAYTKGHIELEWTRFYNYFFNYVYLSPTSEMWFGFPLYRFRQQDAMQYGTELSIKYIPTKTTELSASYSGMISKTHDGNYTPFLPAQKITPSILVHQKVKGDQIIHIYTNADFCFEQNKLAPYEIGTPFYWLLNAGIYTSYSKASRNYRFSISGNNLLNTTYYDHLSRFKNFGLLNIGRNIVLSCKISFNSIVHN